MKSAEEWRALILHAATDGDWTGIHYRVELMVTIMRTEVLEAAAERLNDKERAILAGHRWEGCHEHDADAVRALAEETAKAFGDQHATP